MSEDKAQDPDMLLEAIKKEEEKEKRGNLKVFFGMAAGVGKTYSMLKAAIKKADEKIDVVIGYVQTHGRAETDALAERLPALDRRRVEYKGVIFEEMDIDLILQRRPALVIVDELAHTNVPGARHAKRYQDVLEIIEAGISVYTTLNVQHVDSRADTVRQITGITVHETVPDTILEKADEIELIDIPPETLIKRLNEGKVYLGENASRALENFFKPASLTALREMALRLTAERVDYQLLEQLKTASGGKIWKSGERLMVAVGSSPFSAQLIRWTRRMAYSMRAPWIAVYVETEKELSHDERMRLESNISLATELGAELVTRFDQNIVMGLIRVARQHNVTQIVIGKPMNYQWLELLKGGSLVDRLIRVSGNIDIYVVRCEPGESPRPAVARIVKKGGRNFHQILYSAGIIGLVTILNAALCDYIGYRSTSLIYLLNIILIGSYFNRISVVFSAFVSSALWNFLFIPPRYTFHINSFDDMLMFIVYFIVAMVMGNLTYKISSNEKLLRQNEEKASAMYMFLKEIQGATDMAVLFSRAGELIKKNFGVDTVFLMPCGAGEMKIVSSVIRDLTMNDREFQAAEWTFRELKISGKFTDTLAAADWFYMPLKAQDGPLGVMGFEMKNRPVLTFEERWLFESLASQISLVLDRELSRIK